MPRKNPPAAAGLRAYGTGGKPGRRLSFNPWFMFDRKHPVVRKAMIAAVIVAAVVLAGGGAVWWRLASGPIMLDLFTPWLTAAIEQNLGSRYRVAVGGTQLERDEQGRTALRLRDIVLRDASGATVAVAPKAEVGISGTSLLFASPRAESFRLVDANMTIRIDPDGQTNILVGGDRPFVTIAPETREAQLNQPQSPTQGPANQAAANQAPARPSAPGKASPDGPRMFSLQAMSGRSVASNVTALLAWIDELGKLGLDAGTGGFDGQSLNEIGITNGSLNIDDRRSGTEWKFTQISLNLNRPKAGGVALTVLSESQERPWAVSAALSPAPQGHRRLQLEARKVVLDDLLALRMSESKFRSDTLVSASIDADIAGDGVPQTLSGSIYAQGGSIGGPDDPEHQIPITNAEFGLDWDATRRTLRVPFKVTAGAARFTLRSEFAAPALPGGNWMFALGGGWIVLDPLTAADEALVLKRVVLRGNIDPVQQRITLEQGDLGTKDSGGGGGDGVTVAMSGKFDYGGEPRLAHRDCLQPDVGRRVQAAVAFFYLSQGSRLGGRAHRQRKRGTPRHRDQCHDCPDAAVRPANARGWPVGRDRRHLDDAAPGDGTAVDPRCRHDASVERPHREDHPRQGHRRGFAGTAADHLQRTVRSAEHAHEDAAGARQLPRRWPGSGRR